MDVSRLTFMALWAINDNLDLSRLKQQLDDMQATGMTGVVFHPRNYPDTPVYMSKAYLNIVSDLILHAKSIGMSFWIYDENGWPSGTASGQVIARRPDLICEWVEWQEEAGRESKLNFYAKNAVSSLDPQATALFIEITHEGYRNGLAPEAWAYVTGFFTDEVAFLDGHSVSVKHGDIPWISRLPEMYQARFGEELLPLLPLLFIEGERSREVRVRYWELITDALIEGFYKPIQDWCAAQGKLFTGHLKGEENPFFQLSYSGSCFHVLKGLTMPAIDALERFPGNDFYPRMVHSVSVQQGRESCLVEAHGGSGWGVTPESFTNYIVWLAGHGLEQFVLHLAQFRLKSEAVHDWPPSMPLHLTWRDALPSVLDGIRSKVAELPELRSSQPELLIVTPTRGIMEHFDPRDAMVINEHNGEGVPDTVSGRLSNQFIALVQQVHATGVHYELSEERTLEEIASVDEGCITVGHRSYRKVLVANGCSWTRNTAGKTIIDRMQAAGVEVRTGEVFAASAELSEQPVANSHPAETPVQTAWAAAMPAANLFAVEFTAKEGGKLTACVEAAAFSSNPEMEVVLLDKPKELSVNGRMFVHYSCKDDRYRFSVPHSLLAEGGSLELQLELAEVDEPNPVVFIEGKFLVRSLSSYHDKDARQQMTEGPFLLSPTSDLAADDLVSAGLPFCGWPVTITKSLELGACAEQVTLQLTGINADAAQLFVDGVELGWTWGPHWQLALPNEISAGSHELVIQLIPSTFNVFGPHRHVDGDRHLTSPDQYKGVKNFADSPDAPNHTLGKAFHFVKFGISGEIMLLRQGSTTA
ncbi:hypothetical protein [Paenibacillus sp. P36]|uniref:hypothetical protein n=1 Tax=Paenibacillus sp. P36 TaxID=3342538 RepID=UPI0038B38B3B